MIPLFGTSIHKYLGSYPDFKPSVLITFSFEDDVPSGGIHVSPDMMNTPFKTDHAIDASKDLGSQMLLPLQIARADADMERHLTNCIKDVLSTSLCTCLNSLLNKPTWT